MKLALTLLLCLVLAALGPIRPSFAQANQEAPRDERHEGEVTAIREQREIDVLGRKQLYQRVEVRVTTGAIKDRVLTIEHGTLPVVNHLLLKVGDRVIVAGGPGSFYIADFVRTTPLLWLFGIFVALTVLVGRKRGLASLLGMAVSFAVIMKFLIPAILAAADPVLMAIVAASFIAPITFLLSHGPNRKTTAAILGTILSLVITGVLATMFVETARLSGFASEDAGFLQVAREGTLNIKGLLLAGIIVSVLGILDDITVSQAAIVAQLLKAAPDLSFRQTYIMAMDVGRDHIASVVNTLILVYTGAAMPLLLLFFDSGRSLTELLSFEMVAEEIIRTLVASIGLILAVPITTLISCLLLARRGMEPGSERAAG